MTPQIFIGLPKNTQIISAMKMKLNHIQAILKIVSESVEIPEIEIKSLSRKRQIVEARQIVVGICLSETKVTLKSLGAFLGKRDHSTMIYSNDTYKDLYKTDKAFKSKADKCIEIVKQLKYEH